MARSQGRARAGVSVSPNRDEDRNRSPRAAEGPNREPEVRTLMSQVPAIAKQRKSRVVVRSQARLRAVHQVAMAPDSGGSVLRTTRVIGDTRMRASPASHVSAVSAGCAEAMTGAA